MWIAKFKIRHDDWILDKTVKYNIIARGIPLNSYTKKGRHFHTGIVFLYGQEKDKTKFIASLKRDRRVKESKVQGSRLFVLVEGENSIAEVFDKSLFFTQPVLMKDGFEYWELGSWDKKGLVDFYDKAKTISKVEMLKLKQEFPSVFIQQAIPHLTEKQRKCLELALELGYYKYPRKISVEQLARKVRVPRTTFQEHLRKAEEKMMEILIEPLG